MCTNSNIKEYNINIRQKTIRGVFWNAIEKFLVKGTSFAISIVLARILSPSDYGLIGMLAIFIALSNIFIESGFAKALIQKRDCTDIDYSTAFYTNLGLSILIYIVLYSSAPMSLCFTTNLYYVTYFAFYPSTSS